MVRISQTLIPRYYIHSDENQKIHLNEESASKSVLPDIYYIILDGYAREDVLKELYHYDNSIFLAELYTRGFNIAEKSQSNYIQTPLSMVSALNMRYITGKSKTLPNQGYLMGMISQSLTRTYLESMGYKTIAFSTGFLPTDIADTDYYYSNEKISKSNDLLALLLINSAIEPFIELNWIESPITTFRTNQERFNYILDTLNYKIPKINGPKFIFAHVLALHPPFIFDQHGPISPDNPYIMQDAISYRGGKANYINGYISELVYLNTRLLQTIDGIISNSNSPPIIIIQGDHGPDAYLDWASLSNTCLKERFSILNAFYLPNQPPDSLPDDITTVNTFPWIFNTYFGTQLSLLENHQYFATWENPFPFYEVTDSSQTCEIR